MSGYVEERDLHAPRILNQPNQYAQHFQSQYTRDETNPSMPLDHIPYREKTPQNFLHRDGQEINTSQRVRVMSNLNPDSSDLNFTHTSLELELQRQL